MKKLFSLFCVFVLIFSIIEFNTVRNSIQSALELCFSSLIPSVFIFMIVSSLIINSGGIYIFSAPFSYIFQKLFRISMYSSVAVLLGWTAGFPVGAASAAQLWKSGKISKSEAEYLLSFCSNSGISFIFGVVGGSIYGDIKISFLLFFVQITASVLTGFILRPKTPFTCNCISEKTTDFTIAETVIKSVKNTVVTLSCICGYILLFYVLCDVILLFLPGNLDFFIKGIFELTSSASLLKEFPLKTSVVLASAMLSWSGLCVHMQIRSVTDGLSLRNYFIGKLIHIGISMLLTYLLTINRTITVYRECISVSYRNNHFGIMFLIIIFVILCCIFLNNDVK